LAVQRSACAGATFPDVQCEFISELHALERSTAMKRLATIIRIIVRSYMRALDIAKLTNSTWSR
jgi:hypothetical protein